MGQLVAGGWTQEQSDALEAHVGFGLSYAEAAKAINVAFGTSFTRNSAIGRANRIGLKAPKREPKPAYVRKPKEVKHRVRIVSANGNSNAIRVIESVFVDYKLRCVGIVPRHLSLVSLGENECRYPYGDGPFTFCGHPKMEGSSFCVPHHHLCWEKPRNQMQRAA